MSFQTLHRVKNTLRYRPIFFISVMIAVLCYGLLEVLTHLTWSTKLLISWNIAVLTYLLTSMKKLWNADQKSIYQKAKQQDESKWIILLLVILTLVMCLVAIVVELNQLPTDSSIKLGHLALSVSTVVSAWFFIHTVFAIHYAHDFYLALEKHQEGGLDFPKTPKPTYPDFIYFSYVIGTSAQTADVSLTSRSMRSLNILHIMIAYGFNTTILAIIINVAAGFIHP